MRKLFRQIHIKYPFIDPFINLILGAVIGAFASKAVDDIYANWRFWESRSFKICVIVAAISILYFAKFSNYSNAKKGRIESAKEELNETLIRVATEELKKSASIDELLRNGRKVNVFIDKLEDVEGVNDDLR